MPEIFALPLARLIPERKMVVSTIHCIFLPVFLFLMSSRSRSMNAIVKIENQTPFVEVELNGKVQLGVNARDLHKMLESKQDFSTWIKRRISQCGFEEGFDYVRLHQKMEANNATLIEYIISVDMTKHLGMMERNKKGYEIRKYYIEQEELARQMQSGLQVQIAKLWLEIEQMTNALSACGRFLSVNGKQTKPAMLRELDELIQQTQHKLDFDDNQD